MRDIRFAILNLVCLLMLLASFGITSTSSTGERSGSYGNGAWVPLKKLSSDSVFLPIPVSDQSLSFIS